MANIYIFLFCKNFKIADKVVIYKKYKNMFYKEKNVA